MKHVGMSKNTADGLASIATNKTGTRRERKLACSRVTSCENSDAAGGLDRELGDRWGGRVGGRWA